jgi:hypothetical protein
MPPLQTEGGMAMSIETQESTAAEWLKRLREAEAGEETLVEYTRRLGLKLGEAYRWKQHLRRTGQWPAHERRPTGKLQFRRNSKVRV